MTSEDTYLRGQGFGRTWIWVWRNDWIRIWEKDTYLRPYTDLRLTYIFPVKGSVKVIVGKTTRTIYGFHHWSCWYARFTKCPVTQANKQNKILLNTYRNVKAPRLLSLIINMNTTRNVCDFQYVLTERVRRLYNQCNHLTLKRINCRTQSHVLDLYFRLLSE